MKCARPADKGRSTKKTIAASHIRECSSVVCALVERAKAIGEGSLISQLPSLRSRAQDDDQDKVLAYKEALEPLFQFQG